MIQRGVSAYCETGVDVINGDIEFCWRNLEHFIEKALKNRQDFSRLKGKDTIKVENGVH